MCLHRFYMRESNYIINWWMTIDSIVEKYTKMKWNGKLIWAVYFYFGFVIHWKCDSNLISGFRCLNENTKFWENHFIDDKFNQWTFFSRKQITNNYKTEFVFMMWSWILNLFERFHHVDSENVRKNVKFQNKWFRDGRSSDRVLQIVHLSPVPVTISS